MASEDLKRLVTRARGLSLREIAERRLHHGDGRFLNPFSSEPRGGLWRLLRWKFFSENPFRDQYSQEPVRPLDLDWRPFREQGDCAVLFLRHACVLVRDLDIVYLVDPLFSGLFWFDDFSPIRSGLEGMPRPDHVLITHGHYDHLDVKSLRTLDLETHVITPLGYEDFFRDLGMPHHSRLDWCEAYENGRSEVRLLPCHHWTMRSPFTGPNRNLWGRTSFEGRAAGLCSSPETPLTSTGRGRSERTWTSTSPCSTSGPTSRAGSWPRATLIPGKRCGPFASSARAGSWWFTGGPSGWGTSRCTCLPWRMRREMERAGLADRLVHLEPGQTMSL